MSRVRRKGRRAPLPRAAGTMAGAARVGIGVSFPPHVDRPGAGRTARRGTRS